MYKRGSWAYPINFVTYVILLVIILIFYTVVFFGFDVAKSEAPTVSVTNYKDSTTLMNLLRTDIEINSQEFTIAESLNLLNKNELSEDKIETQINNLLNKIPRPKGSNYVMEFKDTKFGITELSSEKFLEQELLLPLDDGQALPVKLYLLCLGCKQEDLEVFA